MAKKVTNISLNGELVASLIFGFATVTFINGVANAINNYISFGRHGLDTQPNTYPLLQTIVTYAVAYALCLLTAIFISTATPASKK